MGNPTHKSQITTWMQRLPESAYGIERASTADTRRIISSDQTVIDTDTAFENDANYDTGSDVASDMWAITNDTGITIPFDFNFQDIGYFFNDILGGYALTDNATNKSHLFTPQNVNVSRQLPSRTYFKKYGGIKTLLMAGGVITAFTMSGAKTGRLKVSVTVKGDGSYGENPVGYNEPAIESDREYGYAQQATVAFEDQTVGVAQVETATAAGTISGAGNVSVVVTASGLAGSPLTVPVAVANADTAAQVAGKIRTALGANTAITNLFTVGGSGANIVLTKAMEQADDATLNIALSTGTATGLTAAPTSANTTAGVAADKQTYRCQIEDWTLTLNNPEADDGYRVCSDFLVPGDPKSGAIRSEYLVGTRDYMFDFNARLEIGDKMRGYMKAGKNIDVLLQVIGTTVPGATVPYSLTVYHTKARVVQSKETITGNWVGISGRVQFLSQSGSIPLAVTLVNNVASYAS